MDEINEELDLLKSSIDLLDVSFYKPAILAILKTCRYALLDVYIKDKCDD